MMYIRVENRRVHLDKSTLIQRGGEGEVHIDPDYPRAKAIKVYHQPDKHRAEKLSAIMKSGVQFPPQIIAPIELAYNDTSKVVGFEMRQLNRRYARLSELFKRDFCETNGITTKVVAEMFLDIASQLLTIHRNKFLVGDLNDGGFMLHQEDHSVVWVDVDSWHMPRFPCVVGTELYLCPALYGVDLSKGSPFEPWHDWYSYVVLLFRGLLRKHPFKAGTHPVFKSVIERAQQGLTVLDSGVVYPDSGLKPEVLSDELVQVLLNHLKGKNREPFPLDMLKAYQDELVACSSCGLWYPSSRKQCPGCKEKTVVDISRLVDLVLNELIEAQGRILLVQTKGKEISCISEESGKIVVYMGKPGHITRLNTSISYKPSMQFGIHKDVLTITVDEDPDADVTPLYLLEVTPQGVAPVKETSTTVLRGKGAVTASSGRFVYRLAQNMLLACERFGEHDLLERPVTQVFENQCWFTCDSNPADDMEVICGFNRDPSGHKWFVSTCAPGKTTFVTREIPVTELSRGESLLDLSVIIQNGDCLILRKTRMRGKERVRLDLVNAKKATITKSQDLEIQNHPQWETIGGKGLAGGILMHATDQGIIREDLLTHQTTVLKDSHTLVSADDKLLPFEGGILRVSSSRVGLITKK